MHTQQQHQQSRPLAFISGKLLLPSPGSNLFAVELSQGKQPQPFRNLGEQTRSPLRRMRLMSGPATNVDHLMDECSDTFEYLTIARVGDRQGFRAISDVDDVFSADFKFTKDFDPGVLDARSEMTSASSVFEPDSEFKPTDGLLSYGAVMLNH